MKNFQRISVSLIVGFICFSLLITRTQGRSPRSEQMGRNEVLELVRAINTEEADFFAKSHQYASLHSVTQEIDKWISAPQKNSLSLRDSTHAELSGYTISLLVSNDGKRYELGLTPKTSECSYAFFSNEIGLIYEGKALGCPGQEGANAAQTNQ